MRNLIITDCIDNKGRALKGVCDHRFGMHNFEKLLFTNEETKEVPKSFEDLTKSASDRIARLHTSFDPQEFSNDNCTIYYATLQKGFLQTTEGSWLYVAYALFGKEYPFVPGMSEAVPLKKELWQYMQLPDEQRYQKFEEFDQMLKVQPLIYYTIGTSERDWYQQAFRNCIPVTIKN